MSAFRHKLTTWAAFGGTLAFAAGPAHAAEMVCLKSGFCLQALSHATAERGQMALQMAGGSIEVAAADIASVEDLPTPPAAPEILPKSPVLPPPIDPAKLVREAADAQGLDTDFVRSVALIESGLKSAALSKKGAQGLMQLMPGTARELAVDPTVPADNALGGAKYLRALLLRYHYNSALALAAYNAGPGAVERYHGIPPFAETQSYVRRVTREYDRLHAHSVVKPATTTKQSAEAVAGQ